MDARFGDVVAALRRGELIARAPDRIVGKEQLPTQLGVAMDVMAHPVTGAPIAFAS